MKWTRRSVLAGLAAAPWVSQARSLARPSRLVLVFAEGAWDPTFVIDPKLDSTLVDGPGLDRDPSDPSDVEAWVEEGGIRRWSNPSRRPEVDAFFARHRTKTVVVNGLAVGEIAHVPGRMKVLTGTPDRDAPDLAAWVGAVSGGSRSVGCVDMASFGRPGPYVDSTLRLGGRQQLHSLLDPVNFHEGDAALMGPSDRGGVQEWLLARRAAAAAQRPDATETLAAWENAYKQGRGWQDDPRFIGALRPGQRLRLRGQVDTAVDLLDAGVCQSVVLATRSSWDTHEGVWRQHDSWDGLFHDLGHLVDRLEVANLLSSTLVMVVSDLGRSPKRNPRDGKDHWPVTSAMLMGGGLTGGRTIGATDDGLGALGVDLATGAVDTGASSLTPANLAAGVLAYMDVEPSPWLEGVPALHLG